MLTKRDRVSTYFPSPASLSKKGQTPPVPSGTYEPRSRFAGSSSSRGSRLSREWMTPWDRRKALRLRLPPLVPLAKRAVPETAPRSEGPPLPPPPAAARSALTCTELTAGRGGSGEATSDAAGAGARARGGGQSVGPGGPRGTGVGLRPPNSPRRGEARRAPARLPGALRRPSASSRPRSPSLTPA